MSNEHELSEDPYEEFSLAEPEELDQAPDASNVNSLEKAQIAASAADALKAENLTVLDLREITIVSDFFLICTGKSSVHIRSIADRIQEALRHVGIRKLRVEGYREATWILLDFGDVVVHVMAAEQREYYQIEQFWAAAPEVEIELLPLPAGVFESRQALPE